MPDHLIPSRAHRVLLVGAGEIAPAYLDALAHLGVTAVDVLARSQESANRRVSGRGLGRGFGGGATTLRSIAAGYTHIIVATPVETLLEMLGCAAENSGARLLVEKPAALSSRQLDAWLRQFGPARATVAMNRLFFPSVTMLAERLAGQEITSAEFSFTEWLHRIDPAKYSGDALARWGLSNCIHVIGTAFHLIGNPERLAAQQSGHQAVAWHPAGAVFTGSGRSVRAVPFTYAADWRSAGRWSITVRTPAGSYHLAPMECLQFCKFGQLGLETLVPAPAGPLKCGFAPMLQAWLDEAALPPGATLPGVLEVIRATESIFGYAPDAN